MHRTHSWRVALVVLVVSCAACSEAGSTTRDAWLVSTLTEDHQLLLERDPNLVAEKYAKMDATLYGYFRGTAPQFWRDLADPATPYAETAFGAVARTPVVLVGDPHLENVGSFLGPDDTMWAAINDFDIARAGPFHADLRRLVTSVFVAHATIAERWAVDVDATPWADAVIDGYIDELQRLEAGGGPLLLADDVTRGAVLDDLFRRARRDGDIREELLEYTEIVDGVRVFRTADVEPNGNGFANDGIEPASPADAAYVRALLGNVSWLWDVGERPDVTIIGRRWGAGVGSYPNFRYYAVMPGATADQDVLLEVKEIRGIPELPLLDGVTPLPFRSRAQRVAVLGSRFSGRPDGDLWLGWADDGGLSFRIRERTKYQKNVDVERIGEELAANAWTSDDVAELCRQAGALLAYGHVRASWSGRSSGDGAHLLALTASRESLRADTIPFARAYADRIASDWLRFRRLRATRGPLLGARPAMEVP